MTEEREVLEVDVLFVGAGPACLTGAYHLSQLLKKEGEELGELMIALIEKGREVGSHAISGAVMDPRAIRELMPDFEEQGVPLESPVVADEVCFLTSKRKFKLPYTPPALQNHGNYVVSLQKIVRWLGEKMEEQAVDVFPGFPGVEMLFEGDRIVGVRTGDKGLDKNVEKKGNYEPGIDIRAKVTVLGEGSRGSLTKQLYRRCELEKGRNPQLYATGVKEVWKVPGAESFKGHVLHTMGYPLGLDTLGGGFVYGMRDEHLSLGFVTGLDYRNPYTDPHALFQKFKCHPAIRELLKGGEIVSYGAKTIPEGGYWSVPQCALDGCLIVGDSAGFLNSMRLKGIHLAMKSGMLAAETILEALRAGDFSMRTLQRYEQKLQESWIREELYEVRNFRQSFEQGLIVGMPRAGLQTLCHGRDMIAFSNRLRAHPGHTRMKKLQDWCRAPKKIEFPKQENYTFDKLTDVYHGGAVHEEEQPPHLKVRDTNICSDRCTTEYGNPCQYFCPAEVYELEEDPGTGKKKLKLNPGNCVHCKTCDIMDPYQLIDWVPPEGEGGPAHKWM